MPIAPVPLAMQSNPGREFQDGAGRLINCYVEPRGPEGRHPMPVYPVDGIQLFSQLPTQSLTEEEGTLLMQTGDVLLTEDDDPFILEGDPFDGQALNPSQGVQEMIADNGSLWVITGRGVYKVTQGGEATFIGGLNGSQTITADVNRNNQIAIVSDGRYYVLDTVGETLTEWTYYDSGEGEPALATGPLYRPNSVVHYNGYMVVTYPSARWQIGNLNDARYFATADLAFFQFRGDSARRALVRGGDLLIFGDKSLEFWQDVGASPFTMSRVTAIEVGLGATLSAASIDDTVLFVDDNLGVRQVQGYQAINVSSPYIARKIRQAANPHTIRARTYERDGHKFYSISCADFTLTYNLATQLWHEEKTQGLNRRVISAVEKLNNIWYAGNYTEGIIYTMSPDLYKDNSDLLVMEVHTPPLADFPNRLRVKSLYIDALFGTGLKPEVDEVESARIGEDPIPADSIDSDEEEPKLLVYISEDSGENWIFLEELSLGDINSKYEELRIQGVGTSDQNGFTFRLVCSTPVVRGILGMSADLTSVRA